MENGRNLKVLGELIFHLRESAGLSYADLERKTGIFHQTIIAIEHADQKTPNPTTLSTLAKTLGVNPREFFILAGYDFPWPSTPEREVLKETITELEGIKANIDGLIQKLKQI